jgi:peptidoglycan/LPS O-acetylase OafA/YrhL
MDDLSPVLRLKKSGELRYFAFLYRRFLRIWPSINCYVLLSMAMLPWAFQGTWHYLAYDLIGPCFPDVVSELHPFFT